MPSCRFRFPENPPLSREQNIRVDVDVYVVVDIYVDMDVDIGIPTIYRGSWESVRERSFKISDLSRAKGHGDFRAINSIATDVPGEANAVFPIEQEDFASDTFASDTKLPCGDVSIDILAEPAKPRLVKPVNKPSVAQGPGPKLRPKRIAPQPDQQATKHEALEARRTATSQPFGTGGAVPASGPLERKSPPFGERYERFTSYLEKPLLRRVHDLHRRGEFAKIANLLNAAVREYLNRHYPS